MSEDGSTAVVPAHAPGIHGRVSFRGAAAGGGKRRVLNPATDGRTMCWRPEVAERVARAGLPAQDTSLAGRYLSPSQAGRLTGRWRQTTTRYCREHPGLGEFVAGRWLVDRTALERFLRERAGGGRAEG